MKTWKFALTLMLLAAPVVSHAWSTVLYDVRLTSKKVKPTIGPKNDVVQKFNVKLRGSDAKRMADHLADADYASGLKITSAKRLFGGATLEFAASTPAQLKDAKRVLGDIEGASRRSNVH